MIDPVEEVVAIAHSSRADRIRFVLESGDYVKAEKALSRHGWWDPRRVSDISSDPASAVRAAASGGQLFSYEPEGWVEIDEPTAVDRLVSGYFALIVAAEGRLIFAPEGVERYQTK